MAPISDRISRPRFHSAQGRRGRQPGLLTSAHRGASRRDLVRKPGQTRSASLPGSGKVAGKDHVNRQPRAESRQQEFFNPRKGRRKTPPGPGARHSDPRHNGPAHHRHRLTPIRGRARDAILSGATRFPGGRQVPGRHQGRPKPVRLPSTTPHGTEDRESPTRWLRPNATGRAQAGRRSDRWEPACREDSPSRERGRINCRGPLGRRQHGARGPPPPSGRCRHEARDRHREDPSARQI